MGQNSQELWDNYKRCNIQIMGVAEGEEREKGKKTKIFEVIMTEKPPQLLAGTKLQIQKTYRTPSKINTKKQTKK